MVIDNRNMDREEERRADRKKNENRRDVEKRAQQQPMKTFEAKLSEKTAHEITSKEQALAQSHNKKLDKKEQKQSLVDQIIGKSKKKEAEEQDQKLQGIHKEVENEQEKEKNKKIASFDIDDEPAPQEKTSTKAESKKGDVSEEGHKRVSEKSEDQSSGEGSGGSGGGADTESGGQQGFNFGQQSKNDDGKDPAYEKKMQQINRGKIGAVGKLGTSGRGFNKDARDFLDQDLNEMVASVQLGLNDEGQQEFSVQLNDPYFDGLTVSATRTDEGIVLKFICPSIEVRSTFLKFRPKVYARFKAKGVKVTRIDVV